MIENLKNHKLYKKHDFDTIFSELYLNYKNNFLKFFLVSFIGTLLLQLIFIAFGFNNMSNWMGHPPEQFSSHFILFILLIILLSLIIYSLVYGFITYYLFKKEEDSHITTAKALGETAKIYMPRYMVLTFVVILMMVIGTIVGLVFIIIGSLFAMVYLGTSLFVSGSALIAEDKDPFQSIARSFSLTHKDFWTSLGMVVVFFLILILIQFVLSALIAIPGVVIFFTKIFSAEFAVDTFNPANVSEWFNMGILTIFLSSVINGLVLPLSPIFSVLLYYRLKYIEDETQPAN